MKGGLSSAAFRPASNEHHLERLEVAQRFSTAQGAIAMIAMASFVRWRRVQLASVVAAGIGGVMLIAGHAFSILTLASSGLGLWTIAIVVEALCGRRLYAAIHERSLAHGRLEGWTSALDWARECDGGGQAARREGKPS
jgi:hypothetical protein